VSRRPALVALAALLLGLGLVPGRNGTAATAIAAPNPAPASATAAEPAPAAPAPRPTVAPAPKPRMLTLAGQTPFARPDETLQFAFDLADGAADGLDIGVVVHRAVTSRTEFTQSLAGKALGTVEGRMSVRVTDLVANDAGQRVMTVGVHGPASATAPPDATRIVPGRSGIYPTEVQLLRHGSVVERFVTPLVVVAAGLSPLTMAWVWRFDATPAHQPDGTVRKAAAKALGPSGRLVRTAQAAAATDVPLTLAPTPETLTAWSKIAGENPAENSQSDGAAPGLEALRTAATGGRHQLLRSPFVPFDMAGLLEADLDGEIDAEFARGAADQQKALGTLPAAPYTLLAPGPIDAAGLARLRGYGAERLVLPPEALKPRDQRLTPGRPFVVGNRGQQPHPAAVTDPELVRLLEGEEPPALRAARFLAGLSLVALEAPGEPRGVVVVTPEEWDPPAALLDAVLRGLKDNPAVIPATLDQYFATVAPEVNGGGRTVMRDLATFRPTDPGDADTLQSVRRQLDAFAGVLEPNSDLLETADRTILLSRATALQGDDRGDRKSPGDYLRGADKLLEDITSKVRGPRGQRVTLTSRRASIPITLLNSTGRPLQVRVRLESDQLRFLDGAERFVTLASQNTTERFRVESRTTGAFPLEITVTSPDGLLAINTSEMTIRSTVVSGVGAVLTAGAGLFLLVWWGNDLRRSRHRRNGRARRQGRIAAKAAARALDDAERVAAKTG
jgi:hypothetical protein